VLTHLIIRLSLTAKELNVNLWTTTKETKMNDTKPSKPITNGEVRIETLGTSKLFDALPEVFELIEMADGCGSGGGSRMGRWLQPGGSIPSPVSLLT